jgi:hypothetical protein
MNTSRKGHDLKIEIRLALSFLGRPTDVNLSRLTIEELKAMRSDLHAEVRAAGLARAS